MSAQISLILKAVDEASEVVRKVSEETSGALEEVQRASESVAQAHKINWGETRKLVTSFSGLATSCFALYSAFDRVSDASLGLQRANLQVQAATNAVEDAQRRYLEAVEKYGEDSQLAQAALRDLQLAQERLNYAVEKAQQTQENYNQLQIQTALSTIPMMITAVDSARDAFKSVMGSVDAVSGALNFLAANPVMLAITAIAALVSALVYFYNTNEDFRNAVNRLGETLRGVFAAAWERLGAVWEWLQSVWRGFCSALEWGYNTFIKPIIDALSWFYENIVKPVGEFFGGMFRGGAGGPAAGFGYIPPEVQEAMKRAGVPGMQRGGIVTAPTLAFLGEAGPEAVIPLERLQPSVSVNINGPLVNIEGSADKRTVELAVKEVEKKLKTVLIDATSRSAPTKRIYIPGGMM